MPNRFEREFPRTTWRCAPPPLGAEDMRFYLARGRRLRAEAMNRGARRLGSALARAVCLIAALIRAAGAGAAKRAPEPGPGRSARC